MARTVNLVQLHLGQTTLVKRLVSSDTCLKNTSHLEARDEGCLRVEWQGWCPNFLTMDRFYDDTDSTRNLQR